MPQSGRKLINPFSEGEVMTDEAAAAEELQEQPPAEAPPAEPSPSGDQPAPVQEPPAEPQEPEKETPAAKRIRELNSRLNEANQKLVESNERWARLDERRKQLDEARKAADTQAAQAREAAERPDPAIDSVGAELWDTKKALNDLMTWRQQTEQQMAQMQQGYQTNLNAQDFANYVQYQATAFEREKPDYRAAADHAAQWRMGVWEQAGFSPEEARQMVMNESTALVERCRQKGINFAPIIYDLATKVGYQGRNGNGAAPTPQAASQAGRVLAQVAAGQKVQGLGRVPASGNEGRSRYRDMTPGDLANLSEREWSAAMANPQTRAELEYAMRKADGLEDEVEYMSRR